MSLNALEVIALAVVAYFIYLGVLIGAVFTIEWAKILYWPSLVLGWVNERVCDGCYYLSTLTQPYREGE